MAKSIAAFHPLTKVRGIPGGDLKMDGGWGFIEVDMMVDCYGQQQRVRHTFSDWDEWNKVKEQGFYLA